MTDTFVLNFSLLKLIKAVSETGRIIMCRGTELLLQKNIVELYLPGLIGTASHPNMQKILIIGFFLKEAYIGRLNFCCYYLHYVPLSKSFDHA